MRRRKGRGSPPIPGPSPFTAPGWRPDRRSRSGRGRRPPRRRLPAFGAGSPFAPLRGRMGRLCVQATLPAWHGAKAGADGAARPEAAGRQTRTRAAADGSDTVRPASLAGPVRPALVSIRRVGLGEGRPSPWSWGVPGGEPRSTPLENEPDRLRSAISACARVSKTDGSQSPNLPRGALETAGVDAVTASTTSRPASPCAGKAATCSESDGFRARGAGRSGRDRRQPLPGPSGGGHVPAHVGPRVRRAGRGKCASTACASRSWSAATS